MVTRADVISAYRLLLGREPESEEAIEYHSRYETPDALRAEFVGSSEFARYYGGIVSTVPYVGISRALPPVLPVEVETDERSRAEMWRRIAENWRALGEERPHWSVISLDRFSPETFEENRAEFEESGSEDLVIVDRALERLDPGDAEAIRAGHCLEIGCGVGRATRWLATRFGRVTGADVSPPHLEIAAHALRDRPNVTLHRVEGVGDYAALAGADFVYSRIVLQHNPPPVQAAIVRDLLTGLSRPGAVLLQVVCHIDDYAFDVASYLKGRRSGLEMHVLPQPVINRIVRETGCELVEIQRDDSAPRDTWHRSFWVLIRKV